MKNSYVDFIQNSGLIDIIDHNALLSLIDNSEFLTFNAGDSIFNEGEIADGVFIIVSGSVQIFVERHQSVIVMAKLSLGDYFGEQALIKETTRTAGARAYEQVEVLKIGKKQFLDIVQSRKETLTKHIENGKIQEISRHIFAELPGIKQSVSESVDRFECHFNDQDIIFEQDDEPDGIYWILKGAVDILKEESGKKILSATLREGSVFGELAVIRGGLRAATAKARGELKALFIPRKILLKSATVDQLEAYFSGFLRSYQLTKRQGLVTQRVKYTNQDNPIVVSQYDFNNEHVYIVEYYAAENQFSFEQIQPLDQQTTSTTTFSYQKGADYREVQLSSEGVIVKLFNQGNDWPQLQELVQLAFDRKCFSNDFFQEFSTNGMVSEEIVSVSSEKVESEDNSEVICKCMNITRGEVVDAIESGAKTFQTVQKQLGCATVCGGCKLQIMDLVGENLWRKAKLAKVIPLTANVKSFQFISESGHFFSACPGQHIFIRTKIDDVFVQRPYTLTSTAGDDYFEITVKKEQNGLFSSWLFKNQGANADFEITSPQGNSVWDVSSQDPIVCFVAGIGITPAVAILRRRKRMQNLAKLTIHLSVRHAFDIPFAQELEEADLLPNTTVIIHETSRNGWLTKDDVEKIMRQNTKAQFFLCGPLTFNTKIKSFLLKTGVDSKRIKLEHFEIQGDSPKMSVSFRHAIEPPMAANCWPLIGHAGSLYREPIFSYILKNYKEWEGVRRVKIGLKKMTIVANPESLNLIVDRPELFSQSTTFISFKKAFKSDRGIIAHDGPKHHCIRNGVEPAFRLDRLNSESIARILSSAKKYGERLKPGSFLDVDDMMSLAVMVSSAVVNDSILSDEQAVLGVRVQKAMNLSYSTIYPFASLFWLPQNFIFLKKLHHFAGKVIQSATKPSLLLRNLEQMVDDDGISFVKKDHVMRAAYLIPFIIGINSFSNYVLMGLFAIYRDKELLQACREEAVYCFSVDPKDINSKMLPHTHAAVLECLRRFPFFPGVPVTATQDCVIEKYKILRNETVLFATPLTNFSEDLYEDPLEFKWQRYFNNHDANLFPKGTFGYGEHACLADKIAPEMLSILIAYFLHHFEFELLYTDFKFKKGIPFMQQKGKSVRVVSALQT